MLSCKKNIFLTLIAFLSIIFLFYSQVFSQQQAMMAHKKAFTNSIGMKFVIIQAGSFKMGDYSDKRYPYPHEVKIYQSFYLQTTEVTQGQWKKVMGDNPSYFKKCGDDCPVEKVSWDDAQRFIEKINQLEKTKGYRLPSESEWEYACRAGTTTEYSFGGDSSKIDEYAWYKDNSNNATHRVATKKPNPWGIYDMHGNVWEWIEDDWHASYWKWVESIGAYNMGRVLPADGLAWVDNPRDSLRVVRGGDWSFVANGCRSAMRWGIMADEHIYTIGFRLSKSVAVGP